MEASSPVPVVVPISPKHKTHLIATILTLGFWFPGWLICSLMCFNKVRIDWVTPETAPSGSLIANEGALPPPAPPVPTMTTPPRPNP